MGWVAPSGQSGSSVEELLRGAFGPLVAERDDLTRRLRAAELERDRWRRRSEAQAKQIEALKASLEEAQRAAKRQAAPFARRRRKKTCQKPGRKAGHAAANRSVPDHVDGEHVMPLEGCPCCGGPVEDIVDLAPQIIIDIPPVRPTVNRYHTQSGYCRRCRKRVRSRHPDQCSTANGAAGVQVGPRALSLGVDLKHRLGVTFRKVTGIFRLFFGLEICAATLVRAEKRITARCVPTYNSLIQVVRGANVVHADETGWYITAATKKAWLWVFAVPEPKVTLFAIRLSRGGDVAEEIIGADFAGTLGIDGWAGYVRLLCRKGQCAGHLLRRACELIEVQKRGAARFPLAVKQLLLTAIAAKHVQAELDQEDGAALADQIRGEAAAVLDARIEEPSNRRFLNHMLNHRDELFTFLDVPGLAPTNNLGEQEIRPAVIIRKISAGNRSLDGARAHEVLASLSRTAERNGKLLPDLLPELLRSRDRDAVLSLLTVAQSRVTHRERIPHGRLPQRPPPLRDPGWQLRRPRGPLGRLAGADSHPPPS